MRFLPQGISLDERFPKPHLSTPSQAAGALAPLSVSLAGALKGREVAEHYQVFVWRGCGEPGSLREMRML